jgi:hypothetical protein
MYLPVDRAELVLKLLLEGNSVSSVERITGVHHGTILKLLVLTGEKCDRIMAHKIVDGRPGPDGTFPRVSTMPQVTRRSR